MRRLLCVMALLMLTACATSVLDINKNPDTYYGKDVVVKGVAKHVIKLGELSGFTLVTPEANIMVQSDSLPKEDDSVTVKGVVMKSPLFKTYILANDVK